MPDLSDTAKKDYREVIAVKQKDAIRNRREYYVWNIVLNVSIAVSALGATVCSVFIAALTSAPQWLTILNAMLAGISAFLSGSKYLTVFDIPNRAKRWRRLVNEYEHLVDRLISPVNLDGDRFINRKHAVDTWDPDTQSEDELEQRLNANPLP